MDQMDRDEAQDAPAQSEPQPDETDGDITMADVNPMPPSEDEKKDIKLEDLFADDSDDEFPSTDKTTQSQALPSSPGGADQNGASVKASANDPEVTRTFYQRLFPWRYFFQWLNHSPTPTTDFMHREFAYTVSDDRVWRYQSFQTADL